ncbi:hypothetical protein C8Q76DRAFT_292367 [Earliella scabrosa]|nr:hypothetical protein C8Q76DRAFT_292367 [Earliella scabrosa]
MDRPFARITTRTPRASGDNVSLSLYSPSFASAPGLVRVRDHQAERATTVRPPTRRSMALHPPSSTTTRLCPVSSVRGTPLLSDQVPFGAPKPEVRAIPVESSRSWSGFKRPRPTYGVVRAY